LLGPVFFYDTIRLSRRGRFIALRAGYASVLLILLFLTYRSWALANARGPVEPFSMVEVPLEAMPRLAEAVFITVMAAQFLGVIVLTPIYTAGAIAEQRARRTLELFIVCGLTSREIVVGKLAARLVHVLAIVFAGVPVL